MTRPTFTVQPQRSNGTSYVPCELHQATSFAVLRVEKFAQGGRVYKASRVIGRCTTRNQAIGLADANTKSTTPPARHTIRKLGLRIVQP